MCSSDLDGANVMQRVRQMRDRFVGKVLKGMESIPEQDRLNEGVRFKSDHLLVFWTKGTGHFS